MNVGGIHTATINVICMTTAPSGTQSRSHTDIQTKRICHLRRYVHNCTWKQDGQRCGQH